MELAHAVSGSESARVGAEIAFAVQKKAMDTVKVQGQATLDMMNASMGVQMSKTGFDMYA